jgi:hypothetical protein
MLQQPILEVYNLIFLGKCNMKTCIVFNSYLKLYVSKSSVIILDYNIFFNKKIVKY